jgi:hypothetical protein
MHGQGAHHETQSAVRLGTDAGDRHRRQTDTSGLSGQDKQGEWNYDHHDIKRAE